MEHKKQMYRHLMIIYITYFVALGLGLWNNIQTDGARGFRDGMNDADFSGYILTAPVDKNSAPITDPTLSQNITASVNTIYLKVKQPIEEVNPWGYIGNSGYVTLSVFVLALSSIAIYVLFALIINSVRKSIRNEKPIQHINIVRTRWIGGLFLIIELGNIVSRYIQTQEASRLLQGSSIEVIQDISINYWNIIIALLFIFMAEVFSIGSQLSEEQKLTI